MKFQSAEFQEVLEGVIRAKVVSFRKKSRMSTYSL